MRPFLLAGGLLCGAAVLGGCPAPKPQPTPNPTPTATATPVPEPTVAPCPEIVPALVKIRCGRFSDWQDGEQWDCEPTYFGQKILEEGDPDRARCDLEAVGGERPDYELGEPTGDLRIGPRTNPFRFALYGHGEAALHCFVADGHDACAGRKVSR